MLTRKQSTGTKEPCTHRSALPRWERMEDQGNEERIARWYCPACNSFLSVEVMQQQRGTEEQSERRPG